METKKSLSLSLIIFIMTFVCVSCSSSSDEPDYTLEVNPSSITTNAERQTSNLNITSNTSWQIVNVPSWIDLSTTVGKGNETVLVTTNENTSTEARNANLNIVSNDGSITRLISVSQNGKNTQLSVDVTNVILPSTANSSQTINITCNSSWTVSGLPDWLQISSTSGNGNSSVIITTRSVNDSSTSRSATLTISSDGKTQTITVQQEAALASCKVQPSNITTLYYAVVFNLTYSSNVALAKIHLLSDYDFKHMTTQEVIASVEGQSSEIPEDETIYTRGVDASTKYHILSLAYDKNGNRGELADVEFESPKYLNATDDAWCKFDDAYIGSNSFTFTVSKQGRCSTYDIIYGANIAPNYLSDPLMAFEINYYIKNKKKNWLSENWELDIQTNYPNDHTFSCFYSTLYPYGGVIATAWGIFADGTRSSDITTVSSDTYASDAISISGNGKNNAKIEWIKKQEGFIKTTPSNIKNKLK